MTAPPANEPPFAASRTKLQRAERFIGELQDELDRYVKSQPLSGSFDFDSQPPTICVAWKGIGLQPGAIVGDTIHNLRTSLDLMASELARLNNHSDKNVYFPFASSEAEFPAAIKSKNFNRCGEDAVALLMQFSPYRGGNERLRAIHDLDVEDKHTALIPTGSTMTVHVEGAYEIDLSAAHHLSIKGENIDYIFPDDRSFAGCSIIKTLKELVQIVDGILEAFASMLALRQV